MWILNSKCDDLPNKHHYYLKKLFKWSFSGPVTKVVSRRLKKEIRHVLVQYFYCCNCLWQVSGLFEWGTFELIWKTKIKRERERVFCVWERDRVESILPTFLWWRTGCLEIGPVFHVTPERRERKEKESVCVSRMREREKRNLAIVKK